MDHLRRLGDKISVPIPTGEGGFTGRECPAPECEGYFKVQFGTGLKDEGLPCHCPYCGHSAGHDHFWTKEQIEYAKSVAFRKIADAVYQDLKGLEFEHKPKGMFGIGISMKVKADRPVPIHYYREKELETEAVCDHCTLRYAVYGVFAFCPDCGEHNSLQILRKNFDIVDKMLDLAAGSEQEVAERLVENALEDCVSAFDGFGRELCRLHAGSSANPAKVEKLSFQNLDGAKTNVLEHFGVDLSSLLAPNDWQGALRGFQKRHLVAHKMGVIDADYVTRTRDPQAVVGRKIFIEADEVMGLAGVLRVLAAHMSSEFKKGKSGPKVKGGGLP